MSNKLLLYIKESISNSGIYFLNGEIPVWSDDPLPEHISLSAVISKIEKIIPVAYFRYIHAVKIGTYPEMIDRELNAMYKDGVLYISNLQADEADMLDDIVHEIAHAVEENNSELIYEDESILIEFLGKRKRLYEILKNEGFDVTLEEFLHVKYNEEFDMFLFQEVGYALLNTLVNGLFPGPYSVTSINEYFATGFEKHYLNEFEKHYLNEGHKLQRICPKLMKKIYYLDELANEYN
tara:strand:+ start:571 stop:1281 length:711 start_codon:yes stop_codon:yes gene_type:complete